GADHPPGGRGRPAHGLEQARGRRRLPVAAGPGGRALLLRPLVCRSQLGDGADRFHGPADGDMGPARRGPLRRHGRERRVDGHPVPPREVRGGGRPAAGQLAADPAGRGEARRMILAFLMLFAGGMLLGGAWSLYRSKKQWWLIAGVLLIALLCLAVSFWRIQTG